MLCVYRTWKELPFADLMRIYDETNRETGRNHWPEETVSRQIALAEESFYRYLRHDFFKNPGEMYCLWWKNGRAVSAFRLESYRDGYLVTALETAPADRCRGYARELLLSAVTHFRVTGHRFYAHIQPHNIPSVKVHTSCGFAKIREGALMLDGSYTPKLDTYCITDA